MKTFKDMTREIEEDRKRIEKITRDLFRQSKTPLEKIFFELLPDGQMKNAIDETLGNEERETDTPLAEEYGGE